MPTLLRPWIPLLLLAAGVMLVLGGITWFVFSDGPSREISIATGEAGGLYSRFGEVFAKTHHPQDVTVVHTAGSVANRDMLLAQEVELAIVQAGSVSLNDMSVIAPITHDVVFVIVRKNAGLMSMGDLAGKPVILGKQGSGMRSSSMQVLEHYGLAERVEDREDLSFMDLLTQPEVMAAIVTTGPSNPSLRELLVNPDFELWSINAPAIAQEHPFFRERSIPRGYFFELPQIPAEEITTVETTALLVADEDASSELVTDVLDTLYKHDFHSEFPQLISHDAAAQLPPYRLHSVARQYFDPFDQVGFLASVMESIAATKEIFVALIAGVFVLWSGWRNWKRRSEQRLAQKQKDRLDALLERTFIIERQQMEQTDPERLQKLLDQVTDIKLRALEQLTHEDLRGDQCFSIFLMQCANVINKIQTRQLHFAALAAKKVANEDDPDHRPVVDEALSD